MAVANLQDLDTNACLEQAIAESKKQQEQGLRQALVKIINETTNEHLATCQLLTRAEADVAALTAKRGALEAKIASLKTTPNEWINKAFGVKNAVAT